MRHTTWNNPAYTATLTIEPGVEVRFNTGTGLYIGADGCYGALSAQGTAGSPIIFTSNAASPAPGNWKGIKFEDTTNDGLSRLEHCIVEYGGNTNNANIYVYRANPTLKANIIRHSSVHGIRLYSSSPQITNSSITNTGQACIYLEGTSNPTIGGTGVGNVIADIGTYPIYCVDANSHPAVIENSISDYGSHAMRMPARMNVRGNTYAGTGSRSIVVLGENVTADTTWRNEIPRYIVTGDVRVRHTTWNNPAYTATLTIEPGVEVRFNTGTGLYIGADGCYGALSAQGTAGSPIIFTSNAASPAPGNWKGIKFEDTTNDGLSRLEHCIVEYGGHTNNADIYLYHAKPVIQYNTFRNSSHSGIYVNGTGSNGATLRCNNLKDNRYGIYIAGNALPSILNNNFLTSQIDGLYNAGGVQVKAENNWWGDANGPNFNGDSTYGSVDFSPWLKAESDCITSPPTNMSPYAPKTPAPANGAVRVPVVSDGQPIAVNLGWVGSDPNPWDTLMYDVYFGTAADSLVKVAENLAAAQFAKSDLAQGIIYYWQVIARDNSGAETAGPVWHFTTLGSPPDLVVTEITWNPAVDIAAGQTVTITATIANSGEGPVVDGFQVNFKVDGVSIGAQSVSPVIATGASFQLSRTWTATVGTHTVEVAADSTNTVVETFDNNNSLTATMPSVSDPSPPLLVSSSPAVGSSLSLASKIIVTLADEYGTVDDAAVIASFIVTAGGQPIDGSVAESSDQFTFTPASAPLADGIYQVAFTAADIAGNTKAYSFSFTVDGQPPIKPVITGGSIYSGVIHVRPYADNRSKTAAVTLTGARESNTAVWVNAVKKVNIGSGDWSTGLTLAQGGNALEIWLTDAAGNRGPSEWVDIFVDSVAPALTGLIAPPNNSFVNVPPATVKIGFQEAGSGLDLNGSALAIKDSSFVEVEGSWSVSANQLVFTPAVTFQDSNYNLNIQLKDHLTNQSAAAAYHFTVDTLAPVKPVVNPVTSPTFNPNQTISGAKAPYDAILLNGQEIIGNTSATAWQYSAVLASGTNTFTFTAGDRAGNVSEATIVEIVYDDVAPDAVAILTVNGAGSGTTAVLNWTYNETFHGDIAAYRIFYETAAFDTVSALTVRAVVNAGAFTKTFQDLTRNGAYYFAVVPVDVMGNFTDSVIPVAVTLSDILPPAEVTNLAVQSFADRLIFTWTHSTSSDLSGYKVYFNSAPDGISLSADRNTYEQTGLNAATAYPFKVTAIDTDANESSGAAVTGYTFLPHPGNLSADPKSGYVDLSWSNIEKSQYLKHYRVYVSESNFSSVEGMTPKLTVTAATAKAAGLSNNVPYFFAVTSVNLSGGEDKTVAAITATPVPDLIGPEMVNLKVNGAVLTDGYTLTVPGSFSLDAVDPAGVSRVEFYLDGVLVRTDYSPAYTWFWNIVESSDGSHSLTIKAYDTLGNSAEATYSITVALAVPAAPVISQPISGTLTNKAAVTVSGSGPKYSDIIFFMNDVETGPVAAVDGAGNFSAVLTLAEGENRIQAAARNRAGTGPFSATVLVTLDTSLPQAPTGLTALALSGGQVRLTWQKPLDNVSGYNLYRAAADFSNPAQATRVNANMIATTTFTDLPSADGVYYYRVATLDSAGNESELSAPASAASDRTPPRAVSIAYSPRGKVDPVSGRMAPGSVDILLTVSEALQAAPFLTLTPENGVPATVTLGKATSTTYAGVFVITTAMPSGTAYAVFSARDAVGNRGTEISAGASIKIDTAGPAVTRLVIWPNDPVKTDAQNPVSVIMTIGLNEKVKPGTAPVLSYLLSQPGRDIIEITGLSDIGAQSGDVQTWQGTFALPDDAGLSEAETLEFLYQGADDLDNLNDRILADHQFQVYQGDLPPLAAPEGLKAEVLSGGRVRLTWNAVEEAVGYQLYRQGPGETELAVLSRVDGAVEFIDSPPADGIYLYAAASIRAENDQEALSGMCPPITVNSDSVAPGAPANLSLVLVSQGIRAAWDPPAYTEPVTYSIYRSSAAEIISVAGLTPLAVGITQTVVIDPHPSQSDHSYVVTAVDAAGNESAPSNSVYLNFSLLPVSSLTVVQADTDVPMVSWTHGGADIAGYDIYLGPDAQRSKLNAALLTATSFTDVGYSQDERRYTLVAMDANGIESLGRSITLPVMQAEFAAGARLKRGIMNQLSYSVKNLSAAPVSNARLKVNVNGKDHVSESFSLQPPASSLIPVIVGGYSDMEDIEPLTTTIEVTPNAGEIVKIIRTSQIEVGDGMLVLQIANDELVRGGKGAVRFTLENSSDAEVEIITAQSSGGAPSNEVVFSLLDRDNNVLSTQKFKQTIGSMIVGLSNGNIVARIPAGATFASSPVNISVPSGAPDDVTIRLSIANLYYHHGKSDQVKMNGLSGSYGVTLADTAYTGTVTSITPESSTGDSDVKISGRTVARADASPMPNVALKLVITLNGFERTYNVYTDADGNFTHTFTPLAGEAGVYSVRAVHPDLTDKPVHGAFTISRVAVTPAAINLSIPKNYEQNVNIQAAAGDGTAVTNLGLEPVGAAPAGVHLTIGAPIAALYARQTGTLNPVVGAPVKPAGSSE
ncbi:MAG: Ig-like domain-containing protein [Desulfobacterales bacterium]|nr:Ig-like domain-containing protein [Desulfobacterales bacterium]